MKRFDVLAQPARVAPVADRVFGVALELVMLAHEVALFRDQSGVFGLEVFDGIIAHLVYRRVAVQAAPFPPVIVPRITLPSTRPA